MGDVPEADDRLVHQPVDWHALLRESTSDVLFQNDLNGRIVWISEAVSDVLGLDPASLVGTDILQRIHPDDAARIANQRAKNLLGNPSELVTLRVQDANQEFRVVQAKARPLFDSGGQVMGSLVTWQDVHDRLAAMRAFATLAEGNRILLRAESEAELLQQMCEAVATVGGYALAWYGVPMQDAAKSIRMVAVAGQHRDYTAGLKITWGDRPSGHGPMGRALRTGQPQVNNDIMDPSFAPWRERAQTYGIQSCLALPVFVHDAIHGALVVYSAETGSFDSKAQDLLEGLAADLGFGIARYRDAAALAASQSALEHEISFDSLTGLANKRLSIDRIAQLIESRRARGWALLCVGVRGLTAINQAFTYQVGDDVLRELAERLVTAAGAHDRVGRIAGDEFVVLLRDIISATDAAEAAQRIIDEVRGPLHTRGEVVDIDVSVGIAMYVPEMQAESLLRDATAAMRQAGAHSAVQWAFLDQNVAQMSRANLDTQKRLRDALLAHHLTAWFMPIVLLGSGRVFGFEALARWIDRDGSVIAPDGFLAVAERSHLVIDLDGIVLRRAVETLRRIDANQHIAVNVSAATLQAGHLADLVHGELVGTGIDPRRLHLEVTETALLNVSEGVKSVMREVASMGITWWLDDFGTGYSSIAHLRDLPINGVKLDQSFTAGLTAADSHAARLTRGLAGLADGLGLHTIAEGVETAEQAALLYGQGWEFAQGWHFGKPAPMA